MLRSLVISIIFVYMPACLNAQVQKDQTRAGQQDTTKPYTPAAVYNGDINELAKTLGEKYTGEKPQQAYGGSPLVFKAYVGPQQLNALQRIELTEGPESEFSKFMLEELKATGKAWKPMLQGGRAVKSFIRIYARLNSDGSISMKTSNYK